MSFTKKCKIEIDKKWNEGKNGRELNEVDRRAREKKTEHGKTFKRVTN